jgi:carbon monoxide dehydrogenase subunit G
MKLQFDGQPLAAASVETVWRCLLDAEFVARTTPGLQSIETLSDTRHRVRARVGTGAFGLDVVMEVEVCDLVPPNRATMRATGNVANQPISLISHVQLHELGPFSTRIAWQGEAELGGAIGGLGGTMLKAVAPALVERFWSEFAKRVATEPV